MFASHAKGLQLSVGLIGWIIPMSVLPAATVSPSVVGHADRSVQFRTVIKLFACLQSGLGEKMQMKKKQKNQRSENWPVTGQRKKKKATNLKTTTTKKTVMMLYFQTCRNIFLKRLRVPSSFFTYSSHLYCCSLQRKWLVAMETDWSRWAMPLALQHLLCASVCLHV